METQTDSTNVYCRVRSMQHECAGDGGAGSPVDGQVMLADHNSEKF